MPTQELHTALIQQPSFDTRAQNQRHMRALIGQAAEQGAQLVVLQELHDGPYFCQRENVDEFDRAESIPGPSSDFYAECAKDNQVVLITSLFEKRAAGLYHNTAVVFEADGNIAGKYRKMHIPDDPGYYEKFYFTPGDLGFKPIQTSVGKLGVLICWDQWYPEAARLMAMAGADVLIYPTAIGWADQDDKAEQQRQLDAWITIQRSHAIANGLPLLSCNRIGFEDDVDTITGGQTFWGNSFVCGPQGEILAQAANDAATILHCKIDLKQSEAVRRWWPFLRDRRIDAYSDITKRYLD